MSKTHNLVNVIQTQNRIILFLSTLDEVVGFHLHAELVGLSARKREDGWQVVMRIRKDGKAKVAFFSGDELWIAHYNLALAIKHNQVPLYDDKYA